MTNQQANALAWIGLEYTTAFEERKEELGQEDTDGDGVPDLYVLDDNNAIGLQQVIDNYPNECD